MAADDRFQVLDPGFAQRVRDSFQRQRVMATFGATLTRAEAGAVEIELPWREDLTQQDGYLHAGVVTTIADSACGYAAYTLMPRDARVLSVEFKINLLAPARGDRFVAAAKVLKAGRTLTVARADVTAFSGGSPTLVATLTATLICILPT